MEKMPNSAEAARERLVELPRNSADSMTSFYLRGIEREGKAEAVVDFINQQLETEPKQYDSAEDFLADNPDYLKQADGSISSEQKAALRDYSSYNFAWINTVERGFWDYDKLGKQTPEKVAECKATARNIDQAICAAPAPAENFETVRGTDLSGFAQFGVHSIAELQKMKGQMMVERGFTSTALKKDNSFVGHEGTLWIGSNNVEIHYRLPAGYKTSIAMLNNELSYSPGQTEVLINRSMLSYISNVEIDESGEHAKMDVIVVPFELYDPARLESNS